MLLRGELPWAGSCFPELFVLSCIVVCPAAAAIYHCQQLGPYLLLKSTFEVLHIRAARKIGNVISGGRLDFKGELAPLALSWSGIGSSGCTVLHIRCRHMVKSSHAACGLTPVAFIVPAGSWWCDDLSWAAWTDSFLKCECVNASNQSSFFPKRTIVFLRFSSFLAFWASEFEVIEYSYGWSQE